MFKAICDFFAALKKRHDIYQEGRGDAKRGMWRSGKYRSDAAHYALYNKGYNSKSVGPGFISKP